MKFKTYKDETLTCKISLKIDGVCVKLVDGKPYSKNDKKLNFESTKPDGTYELYTGDFDSSISVARGTKEFKEEYLFALDPGPDPRLVINDEFEKNDAKSISLMLKNAVDEGYEGLILTTEDNTRYKVKPVETFDVTVLDIVEGKGKFVGMLGTVKTPMGNVGTGFTNKQREEFFTSKFIGQTIEVACLELTKDGKFRHPRFIRERFDK